MLPDHPANDHFHFPPLPLMNDEDIEEINPNQASLTDRYTAEAIRFIEDNAENKNPFFLYLSHMYVHVPIHTPMKYLDASNNGAYGAAVAHLDASTAYILDALGRLGIDEDTLVIFTSDNGSDCRNGGSNAPLRGVKGTTWEGGMREPCIMRWPGHIPSGTVCRDICSTMDIMPTLTTLSDGIIPPRHKYDGKDISKCLYGESNSGSPYEAFSIMACQTIPCMPYAAVNGNCIFC